MPRPVSHPHTKKSRPTFPFQTSKLRGEYRERTPEEQAQIDEAIRKGQVTKCEPAGRQEA